MNKVKVWSDLENFLSFKYPKVIKNILNICGFDNSLSLKGINEETIKLIEETVNENTSVLKGSVYEAKLPFKFLPGHKILILSIPKHIVDFKAKKQSKANKSGNSSERPKESRIREPESIKSELLLKLKSYANKLNLKFEIKPDQITNISQIDNIVKCVVSCSLCDIRVPCKFDQFWKISNLTAHIRNHFKDLTHPVNQRVNAHSKGGEPETRPETTQNLAQNSKPSSEPNSSSSSSLGSSSHKPANELTIQRARQEVLKEVDNIL